MDSNLKKMAKKAASLKLVAPFLQIPQAMRAAGFSDEDTSNVAKQMHVCRALKRLKQQQTDVYQQWRNATINWRRRNKVMGREEAEGVEGDERGRSRETRQSTDDGATRDEGADDAQGKDDAVHDEALEVAP
jgi:hypothetical protein